MSGLSPWHVQEAVRHALAEDVGRGDLTSTALIPASLGAEATMRAKAPGRIAGLEVAECAFVTVDPAVKILCMVEDGADVEAGTELMKIQGAARSILTAERVALNFVQRLSGVATATAIAVAGTQGTKAMIVDTRKTTPGLRALEKYAVRVGGGRNHRFGLDDAVMIKENHIAVAGGITAAVAKARAYLGHMHKVEVEVETLAQVDEALAAGADVILLDNMDLETMRRAVATIAGRAVVEASGGITPDRVAAVAQTGVDVISLGWITHSAPALDISLDVTPSEDIL